MHPSTTERRPWRGEVVATLLLAGCVAIGFGVGKLPKMELTDPSARPLMMRELRFEDRNDGGIMVLEYGNDRIIHELEPGEGTFVRSVLRALARERKRMELGAEAPFRMIAWSDGRLSLEDTVTGHRTELNGAFGQDNTAAMIELLYAGGPGR
jgi:putative photosynthetic complex assembly protein